MVIRTGFYFARELRSQAALDQESAIGDSAPPWLARMMPGGYAHYREQRLTCGGVLVYRKRSAEGSQRAKACWSAKGISNIRTNRDGHEGGKKKNELALGHMPREV